jgi:tripartite-type tricarboxylate transporter receptor subunit TctC
VTRAFAAAGLTWPAAWRQNAMTGINRTAMRAVLLAGLAIGSTATAYAQTYPDRPIRLLLPYTAGSPNDLLARLVAPYVSARLGQMLVVENRPGGGTAIGVNALLAADADGYTLMFSNSPTHLIAPYVAKGYTHHPLDDFVPIALVGTSSNVMVIANGVPAQTLPDFIAHAKANPGKLNFGYGQGTLPQLVGEMFKRAAGVDIASIPYKGGAQAITDLLGGRIHMNVGTASTLMPLHRSGKLRAIAYTGETRFPGLPEVPTMIESGLPGVTTISYYGFFGRAGLPVEIINTVNAAVNESLKSAELKEAMDRVGFAPKPMAPKDMAALLAAENKKWPEIVKATGFGR